MIHLKSIPQHFYSDKYPIYRYVVVIAQIQENHLLSSCSAEALAQKLLMDECTLQVGRHKSTNKDFWPYLIKKRFGLIFLRVR